MATRRERGHAVPARYRERPAEGARAPDAPPVDVVAAVGPDCLAVGAEQGAPTAREYWQCLTGLGELVLVYRDRAPADAAPADASDDAPGGPWFLHGWWD
jgi:hypothetical protein